MRFLRYISTIFKEQSGVAVVEFAFCISLLMLIMWGGIEVSRYILITQKLNDAANQETNIITSTDPKKLITKTEMDAIMKSVSLMITPYAFKFGAGDALIITDIYFDPKNSDPFVHWRYCSTGVTTGGKTLSRLGDIGKKADLSDFPGFTMSKGDEVIVAEILYRFTPIISNSITNSIVPSRTLYNESMSVPRFGLLTNLVGGSFASNCP